MKTNKKKCHVIVIEQYNAGKNSLVTSVGVERTNVMPFVFLNLFGVLDAKRAGEDAIRCAANESGFSYSIIRPGRLVGGPYTNLDVSRMLRADARGSGITLGGGDSLLGDCSRLACAEAVVRCLEMDECRDVEFSMISNDGTALTDAEWAEAFVGMGGGME